jgi:hypothetical protein
MIRNTEYKNNPAISPSDLKLYASDLSGFYKQKILGQERPRGKVYKGTEVGSMVDVLFTDNANFHKYYVSVEEWKATEKVKDVVDSVFEKVKEQGKEEKILRMAREEIVEINPILQLHNYDVFIMQAIEAINFQGNWGMPARIKAIKDKGSEYFEQLKKSDGREMQPFEWFTTAQQKHKGAMEDKHVGKLSRIITGTEIVPGIDVFRQVPLYGEIEYEGVVHKIKGLLDTVIVNHAAETIQQYDVKVCKRMSMFLINARLSRYDIQGDIYDFLIKQTLLLNYPKYTVKPFKFLVIPYDEDRVPEVFQLAPADYAIARMEWTELLKKIAWNKDRNQWDHYPEYYENKFISEIKLWEKNASIESALELNMDNLFS